MVNSPVIIITNKNNMLNIEMIKMNNTTHHPQHVSPKKLRSVLPSYLLGHCPGHAEEFKY